MTRTSVMILALLLIATPARAQLFPSQKQAQACEACQPAPAEPQPVQFPQPQPPQPAQRVQQTTASESPIQALLGLIRETESADTFALTTIVLSNTQMTAEEAAECIVVVLQSAERLGVSDGFLESATKESPSAGHQALAECVSSLAEKLATRHPMPQQPFITPASGTPSPVMPAADVRPAAGYSPAARTDSYRWNGDSSNSPAVPPSTNPNSPRTPRSLDHGTQSSPSTHSR